MNKLWENIKRVWVELSVSSGLVVVLYLGLYNVLANPLQLLILKATMLSVGVLHAHLIGKLLIPSKVNWNHRLVEQDGAFLARTALYIIIPICYAMGG